MNRIENETFDMERALYASREIIVKNCKFDGPADGESAFKESRDIQALCCFFNLRYPFWHDHNLKIDNSEMTAVPSGFVVFGPYRNYGFKASRNQGAARMRSCENEGLRRDLPGVRVVCPYDPNGGLQRAE